MMSGTDNLWFDEVEEGIDGYVNDSKGDVTVVRRGLLLGGS